MPLRKYAGIHAFYALHLPEFSMEPHAHPQYEIMYAAAGKCKISACGRTVQLREREYLFLQPSVPHCLEVPPGEPCSLLNLEFSLEARGPGLSLERLLEAAPPVSLFFSGGAPARLYRDERNVGRALKDLIGELGAPTGEDYLHELLFHRFLLELAGNAERDGQRAGSAYINRAVRFIADNLTEELHVEAVAGHVGLNAAYLQTLFAQRFSCGIMAYVNRQRMEYASFLLLNTGRHIVDIAVETGYNSRQHFSRVFQQHFHTSPREYRRLGGRAPEVDTGSSQMVRDGEIWHPVRLRE